MKIFNTFLIKQQFLQQIKHNFDYMFERQFLKNNSLKKKLNLTTIEVNYSIEENNNDINVKIVRDKFNKNKYTIIFYYGFLEYFFYQAQNFAKQILKRNDEIYWTVFYYWMEMVFLHEWSHLIRNHFNLLTKGANFTEFGVKSNNLSNEKIKCLEIDADRYAGKFFAGISSLTFYNLKEFLNKSKEEILQFFIKITYYLFYLLREQSNIYPPTLLRTIIFLSGFQEAKYQNDKIFNFIDLKNLEQNVILILIQESWNNKEDINFLQTNLNILDKYDKCIKELLMKEIRIFISHKKEDSDKAKEVYEYIKNDWGFDAYLDEFDKQINHHNVVERIVKNLRDSTHLLVIFSEHTINSMWVPFELGVSYEKEQGIGVLIWPDKTNLPYNLPEYLDEFPKLSCHNKYYSNICYRNDLDKYLEEIKEIPNKIILEDSVGYESEFGFTKTASEINYAAEFIKRLKEKLGQR